MKRPVPILPENYYHLIGRGNNKREIFLNDSDYARFLFGIIYLQSPVGFQQISRRITSFVQRGTFGVEKDIEKDIASQRYVHLVNFSLMPNHFHMTVFEKKAGGIAQYMQRVLNGFTKYHNTKYEEVGHLFQGPYKARIIEDDNYLTYASAYIHRNPSEISRWKNKEHLYPWSSFQDYADTNRWGALLDREQILGGFEKGQDYKEFVDNSGAKIEKMLDI